MKYGGEVSIRSLSGRRWSIGPDWDEDGNEIPGRCRIAVVTPAGTGPRAIGITVATDDLVADRRGLAFAIRSARASASHFRRQNKPPGWLGSGA
jgi:hypothetical protein